MVTSTLSPVAGDTVNIQVTGTDADGNEFPQNVEWTENGAQVPTLNIITTSDGTYTYDAGLPENTSLSMWPAATSTVVINVSAQNTVARLEVNLTDRLNNFNRLTSLFEPLTPLTTRFPCRKRPSRGHWTGHHQHDVSADSWTVTTLDDGPQTITISVGAVRVNEEITVVGNLRWLL